MAAELLLEEFITDTMLETQCRINDRLVATQVSLHSVSEKLAAMESQMMKNFESLHSSLRKLFSSRKDGEGSIESSRMRNADQDCFGTVYPVPVMISEKKEFGALEVFGEMPRPSQSETHKPDSALAVFDEMPTLDFKTAASSEMKVLSAIGVFDELPEQVHATARRDVAIKTGVQLLPALDMFVEMPRPIAIAEIGVVLAHAGGLLCIRGDEFVVNNPKKKVDIFMVFEEMSVPLKLVNESDWTSNFQQGNSRVTTSIVLLKLYKFVLGNYEPWDPGGRSHATILQECISGHAACCLKLKVFWEAIRICSKMQDIELWNMLDKKRDDQRGIVYVTCLRSAEEDEVLGQGCLAIVVSEQAGVEVDRVNILKANKMREIVMKKQNELEEICRVIHMVEALLMTIKNIGEGLKELKGDCMFSATIFPYGEISSGKTYTMTRLVEYIVANVVDYSRRHDERAFVFILLYMNNISLRVLDDSERGISQVVSPLDDMGVSSAEMSSSTLMDANVEVISNQTKCTGIHCWRFEAHGVIPDIVTLAKGTGNSMHLGSMVTIPEIAQVLTSRSSLTYKKSELRHLVHLEAYRHVTQPIEALVPCSSDRMMSLAQHWTTLHLQCITRLIMIWNSLLHLLVSCEQMENTNLCWKLSFCGRIFRMSGYLMISHEAKAKLADLFSEDNCPVGSTSDDLDQSSNSRPNPGAPYTDNDSKRSGKSKLLIVVLSIIIGLMISLLVAMIAYRKQRLFLLPAFVVVQPRGSSDPETRIKVVANNANSIMASSIGSSTSRGTIDTLIIESGKLVASVQILSSVTNNLSAHGELDRGGFGIVYKGELRDGRQIAAKRRESSGLSSNRSFDEFKAEIDVLSKLGHHNLISLLGFSAESNQNLMVYKFMPNGTLGTLLFHLQKQNLKILNTNQMVKLVIQRYKGGIDFYVWPIGGDELVRVVQWVKLLGSIITEYITFLIACKWQEQRMVANCLSSLLKIWNLEDETEEASREGEALFHKHVIYLLLNMVNGFSEALGLTSACQWCCYFSYNQGFLHLTMPMTDVHYQY